MLEARTNRLIRELLSYGRKVLLFFVITLTSTALAKISTWLFRYLLSKYFDFILGVILGLLSFYSSLYLN